MDFKLTRREFLKLSLGSAILTAVGLDLKPVKAYATQLKTKDAKETTTICPYCSVGCGIIVYVKEGKVVATEGDPDHPINEGALCPKGASLMQLANNPYRELHPLYRAPYSDKWQKISWEEALERIAKLVKQTRDKYFVQKDQNGRVVNRLEAIAHVGSAALDNEECYLLQKFLRALGLVYIEHQARV